jgi:hypothetical protein
MTPEIKQKCAERRTGQCRHFNGVQHGSCRVGIRYHDVEPLPCLPQLLNGRTPALCAQFSAITPGEARAEAEQWAEAVQRCVIGRSAASDHAKERGFGRGHGGVGEVPCPVCGAGTIRYSVAGYNGHMHGRCTTKGCVSWME